MLASCRLRLGFGGVLALLACAAAPPGPRGPLAGPGLEVATDFSHAYGHGESALPDGTIARGGADNFWGDVTIIPRRLEARISPASWMDVGAQLGWLGGGIDTRVGRAAADDRIWAFQVAGGVESGRPGPFVDTKILRSKWIRLEAYPLLSGRLWGSPSRLVLAAGLHTGTFYHQLPDPRPDPTFDDSLGSRSIQLVRGETRVETALGIQISSAASAVLFAVEPYWVTDAHPPLADCPGCDPIVSFRQSWGVVFVLRMAARFHPFGLR